jgi:transcriptional regulator with XRE-family HTH domain
MPLTIAERKHQMPFGAQLEVAKAEGVSPSYVSAVMRDEVLAKTVPTQKKLRRVQVAIARKIGVTVDEAFPPQTKEEAAPPMARAS